jgi:sirohydrochlorin cobaltochelatase
LSQVAPEGRAIALLRASYNRCMAAPALILFAHGARDPRWAAPFERVLEAVQARAPERSPMLAFLELMTPDLSAAIAAQVERGHASVRIVPLFLGPGGHLRHDLPRIVDTARHRHAGVEIEIAAPAGEDANVIGALAQYCLG